MVDFPEEKPDNVSQSHKPAVLHAESKANIVTEVNDSDSSSGDDSVVELDSVGSVADADSFDHSPSALRPEDANTRNEVDTTPDHGQSIASTSFTSEGSVELQSQVSANAFQRRQRVNFMCGFEMSFCGVPLFGRWNRAVISSRTTHGWQQQQRMRKSKCLTPT